jgi:hypothetical protein
VDIAVFPEWHAGLLALGRRERLVMPLINHAHPVCQVTLDRARWTTLIAVAVEREELTWPGEQLSGAARRLLADPIPDPAPEATIVEARSPRAQIAYAMHTRQPFSHAPADLPSPSEPPGERLGEGPGVRAFTLTHEGDWTWLSFERKPAEWVLARLKTAGFRWGKRRRAWYTTRPVDKDRIENLLS